MNNKGFAISGILYSVLLLFLMVLLSLLYVLVTRINRLTTLVDEVQADIEVKNEITVEDGPTDEFPYYITNIRGKYEIVINDATTCYAYLPKNILLKVFNGKLVYGLPDENNQIDAYITEGLVDLNLINCNIDGVTKFNINSVETSVQGS